MAQRSGSGAAWLTAAGAIGFAIHQAVGKNEAEGQNALLKQSLEAAQRRADLFAAQAEDLKMQRGQDRQEILRLNAANQAAQNQNVALKNEKSALIKEKEVLQKQIQALEAKAAAAVPPTATPPSPGGTKN